MVGAALPQTFQFVVPNAAAYKVLASVHDNTEVFGNQNPHDDRSPRLFIESGERTATRPG